MEPSRFSSFEARPRFVPSPAGRDDLGFAELRTVVGDTRRRFITVNAVGWAVAVGAPTLTGMPMGFAVMGELTVGTALIAMQMCLVLASASRLDRAQSKAYEAYEAYEEHGAWDSARGAAVREGGEGGR
ncbi:hypothetical protein ACFVP3_38135 [Streptomyces sp. NPDC057806]|uniref:hypothetical protein n=1 Tax=Streptomyces sp. NPDC057806 TaxID=3346255 RepID=UPI0036853418